MTEIELIIFSLEIFCLRVKSKYSSELLKDFKRDVFFMGRISDNLDSFKNRLKTYDYCPIYKLYLRYLNLLDKYYDYINGKKVYLNFKKDM